MHRRIALLLFMIVLFVPGLAWADDGSSKFGELLRSHGPIIAVLASFGFGFVASLTPCVYPMVPITVSIFGATEAKSRLRGALLSGTFVLGIASLFTPMGVIFALTGKLMGSSLSNVWVVLGLALLFSALAASMFGAFELALPSSMTNRLSTVGGVGMKGAFVMGLVMGLIAAPCTGPFLTGILTVIAQTRNVALGGAALFSFSLGLGVLFFLAGAFAMNLPKGGAWMMGIKWMSGVGLAYMAFAYLRDRFEPVRALVAHPSRAFGAVAALVLLVGVVLGVVHILAERRKSPIAHLSKPMKLASILPAICGVVMFVSWMKLPKEVDTSAVPVIAWMTDEPAARAKAAAEHKPVLIDFGAKWCDGCEEFEKHTFPDLAVRTEAQHFVAIKVDATADPDITEKFEPTYGNLKGLPVVIVFDANGKEVERFLKHVPPEVLLDAMKRARAAKPAQRTPAS
jgi:thioredoxin:protein disulfide reductase